MSEVWRIRGAEAFASAFVRERKHAVATGQTERPMRGRSRKVNYYNQASAYWTNWVRRM